MTADHLTLALTGHETTQPPHAPPVTPTAATARAADARDAGTARRLIALDGGPKGGHWYWLPDWHRHTESVRAQGFTGDHPAAAALRYQPTGRYAENPNPRYGHGEIWTYTPGDTA